MKKILLLALALLLASCGFHLRGIGVTSQPLPYQNWHIEGGAVMQKTPENVLRRADGYPVSEAGSQTILHVVDFQKRHDIYTITRAAAVDEYLLVIIIRAQTFCNGEPIGEPMEVKAHCTVDYTDSEVLGKQEGEEIIWPEMRIDAADQITRRLTFLKAQ